LRVVASVLLFAVGAHLALRTIAALHRVIDLWYTMGTMWPRVLRGLAGWGGAIYVLSVLLPPALRAPLLWGCGAYLAFYLSLVVLRHAVIPNPDARRDG